MEIRKRYTNVEKLALARKASLPGCTIASGLPQSTMQGFIKNIKKLEENSTVENNLKAIHKDKTPMITKALILFFVKGQEALNLLFQLQLRVFWLKRKILLLRASLIWMLVACAAA